MELTTAIIVFVIQNYLKLLAIVAPICSLWRYYNSIRHAHIIVLELILVLTVLVVMYASLSLTKMDCNRIANYFMLPVILGLVYFNMAHYHRSLIKKELTTSWTQTQTEASSTVTNASSLFLAITENKLEFSKANNVGVGVNDDANNDVDENKAFFVDTVELVFSNGLGILTIVQLAANLFDHKLAKMFS